MNKAQLFHILFTGVLSSLFYVAFTAIFKQSVNPRLVIYVFFFASVLRFFLMVYELKKKEQELPGEQ